MAVRFGPGCPLTCLVQAGPPRPASVPATLVSPPCQAHAFSSPLTRGAGLAAWSYEVGVLPLGLTTFQPNSG